MYEIRQGKIQHYHDDSAESFLALAPVLTAVRAANLTKDGEKVDASCFEILRVLGTGGEFLSNNMCASAPALLGQGCAVLKTACESCSSPLHTAYGKVFLVRKNGGLNAGKLFAMKVQPHC